MERKKFEQILDTLADFTYTSTTRQSDKIVPSIGRMNNYGDWVPERFELSEDFTQKDHLVIKKLKSQPQPCTFCSTIIQGTPTIHLNTKRGRHHSDTWLVKCRDCKKEIEYKDFIAISRHPDK